MPMKTIVTLMLSAATLMEDTSVNASAVSLETEPRAKVNCQFFHFVWSWFLSSGSTSWPWAQRFYLCFHTRCAYVWFVLYVCHFRLLRRRRVLEKSMPPASSVRKRCWRLHLLLWSRIRRWRRGILQWWVLRQCFVFDETATSRRILTSNHLSRCSAVQKI